MPRQLVGTGTLQDMQQTPANMAPATQQGDNVPIENFTRGASDVARSLGLQFFPDLGANLVDAGVTQASLMGIPQKRVAAGQPYVINSQMTNYDNPFRTKDQAIAAMNSKPLWEGAKAGVGVGSWLLPWTKEGAALSALGGTAGKSTFLGRAAQGALTGPLNTLAHGDTNLGHLAESGVTSGLSNGVIGGITNALSSGLGGLSFGKAGSKIPEIINNSGGDPTQLMGLTTGQVQQKAGQMAGESADKLDQLLADSDIKINGDLISKMTDTANTELPNAPGGYLQGGFSPMEEFLQKADVDFQDPKSIDAAHKFADQASEILQNSEPDAPVNTDGVPQYSAQSWNNVKQFLQGKVNYNKDPQTWNTAMRIANAMQGQVREVIQGVSPEVQSQNALTGAEAALSKNASNPMLNRFKMMAPMLVAPAAINAATGSKSTLSPYMNAIAALGLLGTPGISSPVATTLGSTPLMTNLSTLIGSSPGVRNGLEGLFKGATTKQ